MREPDSSSCSDYCGKKTLDLVKGTNTVFTGPIKTIHRDALLMSLVVKHNILGLLKVFLRAGVTQSTLSVFVFCEQVCVNELDGRLIILQ